MKFCSILFPKVEYHQFESSGFYNFTDDRNVFLKIKMRV